MKPIAETSGEAALRLRMEKECADLGRVIAKQVPRGFGFALFLFEYGKGGSMSYCSTGNREDVAKTIEEWLARVTGHSLAEENYALRRRIEELEKARGE